MTEKSTDGAFILAAAMREWECAEGHFISALAMHERMGAKPWVARTQLAGRKKRRQSHGAGAASS